MIAAVILILFVLAVIGIIVFAKEHKSLALANIVGGLPLAWSGFMEFLGQFVTAANQYDLSRYLSGQYLIGYFLALIVIDAIVHAAKGKSNG